MMIRTAPMVVWRSPGAGPVIVLSSIAVACSEMTIVGTCLATCGIANQAGRVHLSHRVTALAVVSLYQRLASRGNDRLE